MSLLSPDYYVTDVHAIDLDALRLRGVRGLFLDLDNTILPRDTNEVPGSLHAWATNLAERGFRVCLVSNNWHERVRIVAGDLGVRTRSKSHEAVPVRLLEGGRTHGPERPRLCRGRGSTVHGRPRRQANRSGDCARRPVVLDRPSAHSFAATP